MKEPARGLSCRVIHLGQSAEAAAAYLKEHLGWAASRAANMSEVADSVGGSVDGTIVVIAGADEHAPRTFAAVAEAAASGSPDLCLGFLYGRGEEQLLAAARRIIQDSHVGDPPKELLFAPRELALDFRAAHLSLASEEAPDPAAIGDLLMSPMDLTFFVGHSNGLNMTLGEVVLCRHDRTAPAPPDEVGVWPCYHGGPCLRTAGSEAIRRSVEDIGARCVINLICWGVSIAPNPYTPFYTLGEGLLQESAVEVMVTTVRAAWIEQTDLALIYFLCNEGLPLGQVTNRANRLRLLAGRGAELLCFGDPRARIKPKIVKGETVRHGNKWHVNIPAQQQGPVDIRADISSELGGDMVVLVDDLPSGQNVGGVLDPSGVWYATVDSSAGANVVAVELVPRTEVVETPNGSRKVFQDLGFFDSYLHELLESQCDRDSVVRVAETLAAVKEFLSCWPLAELTPGRTVMRSYVSSAWDALTAGLTALAEALVDLYGGYLATHIGSHYTNWVGRYRLSGIQVDRVACRYCGHGVDEWVLDGRMADAARRIGNCHACGLVYDGDPGIGRWIDASVAADGALSISVRLAGRNPYGFAVPAAGVVALERYPLSDTPLVKAGPFRVEGGDECSVDLDIPIAEELLPGVYYLAAAWIVGARVNFLRRPITIQSREARRV